VVGDDHDESNSAKQPALSLPAGGGPMLSATRVGDRYAKAYVSRSIGKEHDAGLYGSSSQSEEAPGSYCDFVVPRAHIFDDKI
jgi:hypothetical protein